MVIGNDRWQCKAVTAQRNRSVRQRVAACGSGKSGGKSSGIACDGSGRQWQDSDEAALRRVLLTSAMRFSTATFSAIILSCTACTNALLKHPLLTHLSTPRIKSGVR